MQLLIVLSTPSIYEEEVTNFFKRRLVEQNLRSSRLERHVTIVPPFWHNNLEQVNKLMRASPTSGIYLHPSDVKFLTPGALAIVFEKQPVENLLSHFQRLNNREIMPHVTIARQKGTLDTAKRQQILDLAKKDFGDLGIFRAETLRLYGRDNQSEPYRTMVDIRLSGSS
jgi:hypothetical protein